MFLKSAHIGLNRWWRYLLTLLLVFIGVVVGQIPLLIVASAKLLKSGASTEEMDAAHEEMDFEEMGIEQKMGFLLAIVGFVGALLALWLCVKYIHRKPFQILITPFTKIDWRKIVFAFGFWMLLAAWGEFISYLLAPETYSLQFQADKFFVLMLISLLLLPLQTSCEELVFRGYLMQGLSLIVRWRWIPLLVTSVAFGLMHFANPEVQKFGLGVSMAYYIGVGLFLGILTLMDDSLELALGIHAATNIFASLFVTFDESALQTAALFHTSEVNFNLMLAYFFGAAGIFTWVVSKKYGWTNWSKCYGIIERPSPDAIAEEITVKWNEPDDHETV